MSYTKTTWRNNQSPAINADNLNHIEQGIYDAHDGLASANNNMELMDNRLQAEIDDANSDISTLESNLAAETSARTQQDSVLSARMDTFTQLPSGSTSGDAELIDIRVGADGTTYSTAGDAVRGQVSDLKNDLTGLNVINTKESQTNFVIGLDGKYIDPSDNSLKSVSGFAISEPIAVKKGDYITSMSGGFTITSAIAYCNESQTSFESVVANVDNTKASKHMYVAAKDGYICFGYNKSFDGWFEILDNPTYMTCKENEAFIDNIPATKLITSFPTSEFEDGQCIVYSTGQKTANGSSKLSPTITLKAGMTIDVYTPSYSTFAVISLYENGTYTPVAKGVNSTSQYNWYHYTAENDCTVVVTVSYDFDDTVVRAYYKIDESINDSLLCNNYTPIGVSSYDSGYFSYNQNRLVANVYSHVELSVNAGEVYKVSGYSQQNAMVCVVTDAYDNTLDYFPKTETTDETFGAFVFEIPENGTKLYVNRMVKGATNREYFVSVYKKNGTTAKPHDLKKLAIVGDSLSVAFGGVTLPYWKLLGAHDNFDVECFARSGHGYYHDPDSTYAFWRQAERITSDTYACLVFGSFNDMEDYNTGHMGDVTDNTYDTICGCMNKTLDAILDNNIGIKVGVVSPTPWGKLYPTSGNYYPTKADAEEYVSKLKAICERKGLPFLDLFHSSGLRPWNDSFDDMYYNNSDACHPNNLGHSEFIYPHIKEFVKTIV